jgi:hypothetical protein
LSSDIDVPIFQKDDNLKKRRFKHLDPIDSSDDEQRREIRLVLSQNCPSDPKRNLKPSHATSKNHLVAVSQYLS